MHQSIGKNFVFLLIKPINSHVPVHEYGGRQMKQHIKADIETSHLYSFEFTSKFFLIG